METKVSCLNLENRSEHALEEGRVFEDLVRCSRELQLLDHVHGLVQSKYYSSGYYSETGRFGIRSSLNIAQLPFN